VAKPKRKITKSALHAGCPPTASKAQAYDDLAAFNRNFEQVLDDLERLGALGLLPDRWQRRFLKICRATLEETRAWINLEVVEVFHEREEREWVRFGRVRQRADE
jgi:hypothetical protein